MKFPRLSLATLTFLATLSAVEVVFAQDYYHRDSIPRRQRDHGRGYRDGERCTLTAMEIAARFCDRYWMQNRRRDYHPTQRCYESTEAARENAGQFLRMVAEGDYDRHFRDERLEQLHRDAETAMHCERDSRDSFERDAREESDRWHREQERREERERTNRRRRRPN